MSRVVYQPVPPRARWMVEGSVDHGRWFDITGCRTRWGAVFSAWINTKISGRDGFRFRVVDRREL